MKFDSLNKSSLIFYFKARVKVTAGVVKPKDLLIHAVPRL
jgi:hypothetical protein